MQTIKRIMYQVKKSLARKILAPMTAKQLWRKIKKLKSPESLVFFAVESIGDTLYCLSLIREIKRTHPHQKIVAVFFEKYKKIVESFDSDSYDEVVFIPSHGLQWFRLKCLTANLGYAAKMFRDDIIIVPGGIIENTADPIGNHTDFLTAIRTLFKLGPDAPIQYHRLALPNGNVTSIPDFDRFHDRIVVLNPYSVCTKLDSIGSTFFESACELLTKKGYRVYTNTVQDQRPVRGSLELRCSLEEMVAIATRIPLVVSLRSGILDLLIPSGVNLFVIYNKLWHYTWYRMENWNCRGNCKEFLYEASEQAQPFLMDTFRAYLTELNL